MAKATLPTDYKNDVMSAAMNNRRRYSMIHNDDGTVSFVDVTAYEQIGSDFGAAEINAMNKAINECVDSGTLTQISNSIGPLSSLTTNVKTSIVSAINNLKSITDRCYISNITDGHFASLKEFVAATNTSSGVIKLLRFKDTGGWGPLGINTWYKAIVMYQNPYTSGQVYGVSGDAIFFTNSNKIVYHGYIDGTYDNDNLTISYEKIKKDSDILDTAATIKANTSSGKGAGALGVKGIYNEFKNELTANNKQFYFDYKNGKYGFNTDPNRGADTFVPFSNFSSATVDYVFGILNETVTNSVRTLNYGNKQKYIDNYKALIFAFGEPGYLYDALVHGDAAGMKIITPEDFAKGENFSVSWQSVYSVNISYVSNTQVKVTSVLRDNRYGCILGIK